MPGIIRDVAGAPLIVEGLRERGLDNTLLEKLARGNWLRIIRTTIG